MAATDRRFLITVDDPGGLIQDLGLFTAARRFFDAEGVPASFMVVPRGLDDFELDRQPTWLEALHGALSDGHDCQLHGLDHRDCEFGPYPAMIAALHGPDSAEEMERDRQRFGHGWNAGVYREKLDLALGIYERAFSRRPVVFRTGALSQTPDLYETMADAGLRYTSNHVADPRGWKYIVEEYDDPGDWDPEVPPVAHFLTDRIVSLPIISEYAWYLTEEKIPRHLALALDDLGRVYNLGGLYILVCHVQCVGADDGLSRRLLHELFAIARQEYGVKFQTFTELIADIEAGLVPVIRR